MMRFLILATGVLSLTVAQAANFLTVEGRLTDAAGIIPVEEASVTFHLDIYSPSPTSCLLYSESHTVDMSGSKGYFNLKLGQGTRSGANFEDTSSLTSILSNSANQVGITSCATGSIFNPAAGASRFLAISYDTGGGVQELSQDIEIGAVQYANYANSLQGKSANQFLQIQGGVTQANINTVFDGSSNYAELLNLLSGSSSNYMPGSFSSTLDLNSQKIENLANPSAANDAANKSYVDSSIGGSVLDLTGLADGQSLVWDNTNLKWVAASPVAVDSTKLPLAGGTMTGALNMGSNNITTSGTLAAGTVSVTGGIAVGTGLNSAGAINLLNQNQLQLGDSDGSHHVGFMAPVTVLSNTIWTLPSADGSNGNVLSTNGSGVLSWVSMPAVVTTHGGLSGLTNDDHTQYALLSGRSGGQSFIGGNAANNNLTIDSTSHATKGNILLQPNGGNVGIGTISPSAKIDIHGSSDVVQWNVKAHSVQSINQNILELKDSSGALIGSFKANGSATAATDLVTKSYVDSAAVAPVTQVFGRTGAISPQANDYSAALISNSPSGGISATDLQATVNELDSEKASSSEVLLLDGSNIMSADLDAGGNSLRGLASGSPASPSLSFWGDSHTGIYSPSNDFISFSTAGTDAMTIDPLGKVGIGILTPAEALDVNGNANLTGNLSVGGTITGLSFSGDGSLLTGVNATVAPGTITSSELAADAVQTSNISDGSVTSAKLADGSIDLIDLNSGLFGVGVDKIMKSDSSGNVGVGTVSPTALLHVEGSAAPFKIYSPVGSAVGAHIEMGGGGSKGLEITSGASGTVGLLINSGGGPAAVFQTGNVGIGTTSPAHPLDVLGKVQVKSDGILRLTNDLPSIGAANNKIIFESQKSSGLAVQNDYVVGQLLYSGYDGSTYQRAANIDVIAAANFSPTSSPGRFVFSTTPPGATVPVNAMKITENQDVEVTGYVQIGESSTSCSASITGAIRWNSGIGVFEGCDGSGWKALSKKCSGSFVAAGSGQSMICIQKENTAVQGNQAVGKCQTLNSRLCSANEVKFAKLSGFSLTGTAWVSDLVWDSSAFKRIIIDSNGDPSSVDSLANGSNSSMCCY